MCDNLDEFEDAIYLMSFFLQKRPINTKIVPGTVTNAGFEKCCYGDHLFLKEGSDGYMALPSLCDVSEKLKAVFEKYKLSAIIDLSVIVDKTPTILHIGYYKICKILVSSAEINCILMSPVPETHIMCTTTGDVGKVAGRDFMKEPESFPILMKKLAA